MKTVILTTDFSPHAEHAINYTLNLFDSYQEDEIQYLLVNTFQPLSTLTAVGYTPELDNTELIENAESKFLEVVKDLAKKVNLKPIFDLGEFPEVVHGIEEKEDVDLIVMGCHDESRRLLQSESSTSRMVEKASSPILMIPKNAPIVKPKSVALAADYEPLEVRWESFTMLKNLIEDCRAKLTVVHVFSQGESLDDQQTIMNKTALHRYLEATAHEHMPIYNKDPYQGIAQYATEYQPDMMVVIPRSRTFLAKLCHQTCFTYSSFARDHHHAAVLVTDHLEPGCLQPV